MLREPLCSATHNQTMAQVVHGHSTSAILLEQDGLSLSQVATQTLLLSHNRLDHPSIRIRFEVAFCEADPSNIKINSI